MDVNEIFFIGHNKYGQAGTGQQQHNKKYLQPKEIVFKTFIKQVSCGNHHSALLTINGYIYNMGSNIHGTLGLGNSGNINYAFKPTLVKDIKDVDQVVSGSYHMCAIRQGELYTWGKGIDGQLGHGNMKNVFVPTKVQALGNDVESVSCGLNHTLVTVSTNNNNNLNGYSFGSGIYGQLGCGSNRSFNHPVNIKLPNIESISAGQNHSLFISQGQLYGSGDNSSMQLGQLEDQLKNKKYILQPIKLEFFSSKQQISLIDCHNLSVIMNGNNNGISIWGGKFKIWPPILIDQPQIVNFKVANQKVYYINGKNQLVLLTFIEQDIRNPLKQILLTNKNVLDLDCGQNHLLAVGDIVAQTQEKADSSFLSLWKDESLTVSKKLFCLSQKNIIKNTQSAIKQQLQKTPINQQMSEFYFTMHLKSGMSEQIKSSSQSQKNNQESFQQSAQWDPNQLRNQSLSQTFKTFQNISSSIEIQSRFPLDINQSDPKNGFNQQQGMVKNKQMVSAKTIESRPFSGENTFTQAQTKQFSQMKLQRLMMQMQQKTIHLKRNYPMPNNGSLKYENKSITKTPSSYIKKEPQKFVIGSQQYNQGNFRYQDPKISQFDDKMPVGLILQQKNDSNKSKQNNQYSYKDLMRKNVSRQSISSYYQKNKQTEQERQTNQDRVSRKVNEIKNNGDEKNIETIFMQLLRKQKERASEDNLLMQSNNERMDQESQQLPKRRKRLSHSCISSKQTQSSTSRIIERQVINQQKYPQQQHYPINRSPIQQNKLTTSKISQHSNISGKTNFKKNTQLLEISRSNRQLRYELRDRDLKISQLQQQLSKKEIEMQMLYSQLQYFRSSTISCQKCGNEARFEDPFFSN